MVNVTVNFNVNVDASGSIEVFGLPAPTVTENPIYPVNLKLSAAQLTKMIAFWEPSDDLNKISCKLAENDDVEGSDGLTAIQYVTQQFEMILCDNFDASGAYPFNLGSGLVSKYNNSNKYYEPTNFGRLVVGNFADQIFGHVAATAALSNDKEIMKNILSVSTATDEHLEETNPNVLYDLWDRKTEVLNSVIADDWTVTQSSTDSNIAVAFGKALYDKGVSGGILQTQKFAKGETLANITGGIAAIVAQVIGQDASRAMTTDNNELAPDVKKALEFKEGDTLFMNITIPAITPSYGSGQQLATPVTTAQTKYTVVLKLAV